MFSKVLVANRGEIALRIIRACRELGIQTVAIYSEADKAAMYVGLADEAICIGPSDPTRSYLNAQAIISAAEITGAEAIHPGYGFLSESASFSEQVERSGFVFIGPDHDTIRLMGNKVLAIEKMREVGIPCLKSSPSLDGLTDEEIEQHASQIGYPLILKAAHGGGGRGMHIVRKQAQLLPEYHAAVMEAKTAFGDGSIYMETFLENPSHIEIQVMADGQGRAYHLFERECSIQRRHQKVIEEAPAGFKISDKERQAIGSLSVHACLGLGYRGAGTFEFLHQDGTFYFIEMNTRVQVEHPVTEMITGKDIVKAQLAVAAGVPLAWDQADMAISGHAIECRINAEHPCSFVPSPGKISLLHVPGGCGVRFDSHLYSGYVVPHYYDSMIGKLICHAQTRSEAISKMKNALEEMIVEGISTNIPLHLRILSDEKFKSGQTNIHFLESSILSGD